MLSGLMPKKVRACDGCTLCCKLMPISDDFSQDMVNEVMEAAITVGDAKPGDFDGMIKDFNKPAGQDCPHQCNGCAIYAKRPIGCRLWQCAYVSGADLPWPHECHYVVDVVPDVVRCSDVGKPPFDIDVVQVWVDPAYPEAHRDLRLRVYLAAAAEQYNAAAIIRYGSHDSFVLFAPCFTGGHGWVEKRGEVRNDIGIHGMVHKSGGGNV